MKRTRQQRSTTEQLIPNFILLLPRPTVRLILCVWMLTFHDVGRGYSAQPQELHSSTALQLSKVSHWFHNDIQKLYQKTKKNLSNGGLSVACFKCKPACLEHLHRSSDSMLKLEDWSICQRQKASLVLVRKQAKVDLKQVKWSHPGSTHVPRLLLQTKSIIENQLSASFSCLRARRRGFLHLFEPGFPSGPEVVLDFYRCRTAARRPLSSGKNCLP